MTNWRAKHNYPSRSKGVKAAYAGVIRVKKSRRHKSVSGFFTWYGTTVQRYRRAAKARFYFGIAASAL